MARTVRNAKIDTRSARVKLTERREPYWTPISAGCAIGYRRGAKGGTWVARFRGEDGKQHYEALGAADDARDADGLTVYSFAQAQEVAREFFARKARQLAGHVAPADGQFTVADALDAYFADREQRGSKGLGQRPRRREDAHPARAWRGRTGQAHHETHSRLAIGPGDRAQAHPRRSPRRSRKAHAIDVMDVDVVRARRATANRTLTVLKAALNHAYHESRVASDEAWRKVKPFREVDAPVVHFLSDDECRRIVNACDGAFRNIVKGALLTGCRYGELTRMRAGDFNAEAGTITVHEVEVREAPPRRADGRRPGAVYRTDGWPRRPRHGFRSRRRQCLGARRISNAP